MPRARAPFCAKSKKVTTSRDDRKERVAERRGPLPRARAAVGAVGTSIGSPFCAKPKKVTSSERSRGTCGSADPKTNAKETGRVPHVRRSVRGPKTMGAAQPSLLHHRPRITHGPDRHRTNLTKKPRTSPGLFQSAVASRYWLDRTLARCVSACLAAFSSAFAWGK